jgi:DNA end-binding protein Ku
LLAMSVLNFDATVTKPSAFEDEAPKEQKIDGDELKLAKDLIGRITSKKFDIAKYKDDYTDKLTQLIEAKVAGKEIVAQPSQEPGQIINLMEALKGSIARAEGKEEKPAKKLAPSRSKQAGAAKKRKSS